MIARFNFASALATNRIKGTKIDLARLLSGVDEAKKDSVATKFISLAVSGDLSSRTRAALEKILQSGPAVNPTASAIGSSAKLAVGYYAKAALKTPRSLTPFFSPTLIKPLIRPPPLPP